MRSHTLTVVFVKGLPRRQYTSGRLLRSLYKTYGDGQLLGSDMLLRLKGGLAMSVWKRKYSAEIRPLVNEGFRVEEISICVWCVYCYCADQGIRAIVF